MIKLPTKYGNFDIDVFEGESGECIIISKPHSTNIPFVRIHSSCVFSESLFAQDCDCSLQLEAALRFISENGGIVIYCYEEGRGIGISNKVKAIELEQKSNMNTAEAFHHLGFSIDPRNYKLAIQALVSLGIKKVLLGTDNPRKIQALNDAGIEVVDRVYLKVEKNDLVKNYLNQKINILGHYEKN